MSCGAASHRPRASRETSRWEGRIRGIRYARWPPPEPQPCLTEMAELLRSSLRTYLRGGRAHQRSKAWANRERAERAVGQWCGRFVRGACSNALSAVVTIPCSHYVSAVTIFSLPGQQTLVSHVPSWFVLVREED